MKRSEGIWREARERGRKGRQKEERRVGVSKE